MPKPEHSFRTYTTASPVHGLALPESERAARLEEERAMRYLDQAANALRLATECLNRARRHRAKED